MFPKYAAMDKSNLFGVAIRIKTSRPQILALTVSLVMKNRQQSDISHITEKKLHATEVKSQIPNVFSTYRRRRLRHQSEGHRLMTDQTAVRYLLNRLMSIRVGLGRTAICRMEMELHTTNIRQMTTLHPRSDYAPSDHTATSGNMATEKNLLMKTKP